MREFLQLVIAGAATGAIYSLIAAGLTVSYTATGIFNLAYGAIAFALLLARLRPLLARLERSDFAALLRHALTGNIVYYILLALGVKLAGVAPT